jgi:flavin reductase (DIM6/NTAB) family NADH-FMN oxidoreductase RutF
MTTTSKRADYPVDLVHRLIEPGPVILISTAYRGESNLMTNGFNMPIGHGGPIGVVLGPWDHSYTALDRTGECVLGVPSADLMETVVAIGNVTGADIDKWTQYGLTPDPAKEVTAPLVRECFANIECRVRDRRLVADYSLWILQPVRAWIDEERRGTGEFHHRGDGTFSTNGITVDHKELMTKWHYLTA